MRRPTKYVILMMLLTVTITTALHTANGQTSTVSALVRIDPPGTGINTSTYNNDSFSIQNTSGNGIRITEISYDLSTNLLPKIIFDPNGTGGDIVSKGFTPNSGASNVGLQTHNFTQPYNAQQQGYYGLEASFNNFDPGETLTFSLDVDPVNIRGLEAPGPGESGSVSGLEMVGMTVSVTFSNGQTYSEQVYRTPNSTDAAQNSIGNTLNNTLATPGIAVLGLNTPATVPNPNQYIRVNGPVGASVSLLNLEAALYTPLCNGCNPAPYEVNSAAAVNEYPATIGPNGYVDLPITLTRANNSAGYNYLVATLKASDGSTGTLSNPLILRYNPGGSSNAVPVAADDSFSVLQGDDLTGNVLANDQDANGQTLTTTLLTSPTKGTLNFNTNGSFTYVPGTSAQGTDSFTYLATDGVGGSDPATVTITITDPANCSLNLSPWQSIASLPAQHYEASSAVINGKFYVFAGFSGNWPLIASRRVDVYNPATNVWETQSTPRQQMPFATTHMAVAVDGQYVWFMGGFSGNHPGTTTAQVWRYDALSDQWWRGPDLPAVRAAGGAARVGRTLHFFGGVSANRDNDNSTHWTLNLDNPTSWTNATAMARPRNHFPGFFLDGLIYAIGGEQRHDTNPVDLNYLDVYNPATQSWSTRANLVRPRSHFEGAALNINNRIVILGGRSNTQGAASVNNVSAYNPQNNTWTELRSLPTSLIGPSAAYIDGKLYVSGGGADYNQHQTNAWASTVTTNCETQPTPVPSPTSSTGQYIASLTLVNADTNQDIAVLTDGYVINFAAIGTQNLSIRANTSPTTVGSVRFGLDSNSNFKTESYGPYTIAGDSFDTSVIDYYPWTPSLGAHTLTVTAFTQSSGNGAASNPYVVRFTVINQQNTATPTATHTSSPTPSATFTQTNTPTATGTLTSTHTPTATATPTDTYTPTSTFTPSNTPTATETAITTNVPRTATSSTGQFIASLSLINADTDQVIGTLTEGYIINFATIGTQNLNIRANTSPATVGSVRFGLDGNSNFRTETYAPYSIGSDTTSGGVTNYYPWTPSLGTHTLTVTAFTQSGGNGSASNPYIVHFTVVNQQNTTTPTATAGGGATATTTATATNTVTATNTNVPGSGQSITQLVLINADTDQPIGVMTDGMVINFATIGTNNLNIRADTNPSQVGSVRFSLDGSLNYKIENYLPYSIAGDSFTTTNTDYYAWTPSEGSHTLTVTPFTNSGASGQAGAGITLQFTVVTDGITSALFANVQDMYEGFETATDGRSSLSLPQGWRGQNLTSDDHLICMGTNNTAAQPSAAEGNCAFRFSSNTANAQTRLLKRTIRTTLIAAGDALTLRLAARARNLRGKVYAQVRATYADGSQQTFRLPLAKGTYGYMSLTESMILRDAPVRIQVALIAKRSGGRVYLDDIALMHSTGSGIRALPVPGNP